MNSPFFRSTGRTKSAAAAIIAIVESRRFGDSAGDPSKREEPYQPGLPLGIWWRNIPRLVGHLDLRQCLGIHDVVFLDDAVEVKEVRGQTVHFVRREVSLLIELQINGANGMRATSRPE